VLDKGNLARHLLRLPDMAAEAVATLIDPADHQNVPKAVKLLRAIISLSNLPSVDLNPTEQKANRMLKLLGIMLQSLVEPFVNVNMSLSEQLTCLSTYAFLAFTMFRLHGISFSSNQLYTDSQSMIKNAYFCVRKQQCLDPTRPIYALQFGDDRLKMNFSEVQCGTH
jgi:hypothetical protein